MSTPLEMLRTVVGYDRFIDIQEPVIEHLLAGRDALVAMPTADVQTKNFEILRCVRADMHPKKGTRECRT